jgi:hypothetical protein
MATAQNSMARLMINVFILGIICYGFMLIFLGPQRAGKAASKGAMAIGGGLVKITFHLLRILIMFLINTTTLLFRLTLSAGRPGVAGEAFAHYIERMTDVITGA